MSNESELWLRRQKFGASRLLASGHAYENWYEQYHPKHPEYFAQQLDGSRNLDTQWMRSAFAKLCVSNPAVVRQAVQLALEQVKPGSPIDAISVGENDSAFNGFCLCASCRAMDPPQGPKVTLHYATGTIESPALSDRYVSFYSQVAAGVAERYPDLPLVGLAYGAFSTPPIKAKAHPNLVIQYCGSDLESAYEDDAVRARQTRDWEQWSATGAKMAWRPNWLRGSLGMMWLYHHKIGQDLRYFAQRGLLAGDFDTMMHDWATQGLNYYVMGKMMWDPDQDVDALVSDYCKAAFGPAAAPMKTFFDRIERMSDRREAAPGAVQSWSDEQKWAQQQTQYFVAEPFLSEAEADIEQARKLAAGDAETLSRIDFIALGLEFTKLRANLMAATLRAAKDSAQGGSEVAALAGAHERFLKEHNHTFAFNAPYAMSDRLAHPHLFGPRE
jgi:hypothetical protein